MRTTSRNLETLKKIQEELKGLLVTKNTVFDYTFVGGCDVSYRKNFGVGVFVVLDRGFNVVDVSIAKGKVDFPYIPGFLAFREVPLLIEAYKGLKVKPDVTLVDGQGIAHPRGFGVASHLGVILGIPTIGAAKSRLYGKCDLPELKKGNYTYLFDGNGKVIGACLVTRSGAKPIYISPGHLVDLENSIRIVLENSLYYRIPEPLRVAHKYSKSE